jgi:hypothetical protein
VLCKESSYAGVTCTDLRRKQRGCQHDAPCGYFDLVSIFPGRQVSNCPTPIGQLAFSRITRRGEVVRIPLVRTPDVRSAERHEHFCGEEEVRNRAISRTLSGLRDSDPELVFAGFDVVVDDQREDYKYPHGKNAHSGDGFRNQARQNHPSTAED